jgi:integrase
MALVTMRKHHRWGNVRKAWRTTLKRAGVSYFQIYNLRHVFCTRLSWVAPDAVVQRAMRHSSPETKRVYQLGLVHQVREHMERANDRPTRGAKRYICVTVPLRSSPRKKMEGCN